MKRGFAVVPETLYSLIKTVFSREYTSKYTKPKYLPPKCTDKRMAKTMLWRKISLWIALPLVLIMRFYIYCTDSGFYPDRPDFIKYDYLCIRKKRFPWGDGNRTFFHNRYTNALPDGYEE